MSEKNPKDSDKNPIEEVKSKPLSLSALISNRGAFSGLIELPHFKTPWYYTFGLIVAAYLLSFWVRLEWIDFAQASYSSEQGEQVFAHPEMVRDGVALPNTHDSFYFGSIVQKASLGMHQNNSLIPGVYTNGMITALPYWLLKLFPEISIEKLLLWLPVCVAGLVCVPIILIGRLYDSPFWGFFAACLAGVTHSYYNRTLAGYYDTDMFSITAPAFSMFFLLAASRKESIAYLCAGTVSLLVGSFFYGSVQAITCSMALVFVCYRIGVLVMDFWHRKKDQSFWEIHSLPFTIATIICMAWVLFAETWFLGTVVEVNLFKSLSALTVPLVVIVFFTLWSKNREIRFLKVASCFGCLGLIVLALGVPPIIKVGPLSDSWSKITGKLQSYSAIAQKDSVQSGQKRYSLKFLDVTTTIREASEVPKRTVLNRILSDFPSCNCPRCLSGIDREDTYLFPTAILGFIGLVLLILRYWEFCLTLPFMAIAYYCYTGSVGLRFTVHAGNVAAIGSTFLLLVLLWFVVRKFLLSKKLDSSVLSYYRWGTLLAVFIFVVFLVHPNVKHAQNYHSHVVYPTKTIEVLEALNEASDPDDFVVTWWDYGSGCWYYGDVRSFTSPAHQTFDNYLTSEILRSTQPLQAARLARLKTETFAKLEKSKEGSSSNYITAVQAIFKDGQSDSEFYQGLLSDLGNPDYEIPAKTREMFLFLPYEILRIFPTILSFSSRNLYFPESGTDGQKNPNMSILRNGRREGSSITFDGGFRFDRRGNLKVSQPNSVVVPYSSFLATRGDGKAPVRIESFTFDGLTIPVSSNSSAPYHLLYVAEKRELVILSSATYRSTFARRFLLDRFDLSAYEHPLFGQGANPVRQPFMVQADWVSGNSSKLNLHMRGNYTISVDLIKNMASIPGSSQPIPFSFHRRLHDPQTGKINKLPSKEATEARYHLIQSNLPIFIGGRTYEVPEGGKSLSQISALVGLPAEQLSAEFGKDIGFNFEQGEKLEIPAKGYEMTRAWFFMDDEAFKSVLVQGFLMEDLPNEIFEKVYSTAWGKVYKINQ